MINNLGESLNILVFGINDSMHLCLHETHNQTTIQTWKTIEVALISSKAKWNDKIFFKDSLKLFIYHHL